MLLVSAASCRPMNAFRMRVLPVQPAGVTVMTTASVAAGVSVMTTASVAASISVMITASVATIGLTVAASLLYTCVESSWTVTKSIGGFASTTHGLLSSSSCSQIAFQTSAIQTLPPTLSPTVQTTN